MLLDYLLCGCCLYFCLPPGYLLYTLTPSLFTPALPCYPPNDLLLTFNLSCAFILLSAIMSVRQVGGEKIGGMSGLEWMGIYCANTNTDTDDQYGSYVLKRFGA